MGEGGRGRGELCVGFVDVCLQPERFEMFTSTVCAFPRAAWTGYARGELTIERNEFMEGPTFSRSAPTRRIGPQGGAPGALSHCAPAAVHRALHLHWRCGDRPVMGSGCDCGRARSRALAAGWSTRLNSSYARLSRRRVRQALAAGVVAAEEALASAVDVPLNQSSPGRRTHTRTLQRSH